MAKEKKVISLNNFSRAKRSVFGRLSRLRGSQSRWGCSGRESPIQEIGVFEVEIRSMELTLNSMRDRLENATVTIEI